MPKKIKAFSVDVYFSQAGVGLDRVAVNVKLNSSFIDALSECSSDEINGFRELCVLKINELLQTGFQSPSLKKTSRGGRYAWMKPGAKCCYSTFDDESNLFCTRSCEIVSGDMRKSTDGRLCVQVRNDQNKTVWVLCAGLERINGQV